MSIDNYNNWDNVQINGLIIEGSANHVILQRDDLLSDDLKSNLDNLVICSENHVIQKQILQSGDNGTTADLSNYYTKNETDLKIFNTITSSLGKEFRYDYSTGLIHISVENLNLNYANNEQYGVVKIGNGIDVNNGVISILSKYTDYLDQQIYQKPTLSYTIQDFPNNIQDPGYQFVGNKEVKITSNNVENIDGNIILKNISSADVIIDKYNLINTINFNIKISNESSHQISLSCVDTNKNKIQSDKFIYTKFPIFIGIGDTDEPNIIQSYYYNTIEQKINNLDEFMWIIIPNHLELDQITANGFGVSVDNYIIKTITNKYCISKEYKYYRLSNRLNGSLKYDFKIILK